MKAVNLVLESEGGYVNHPDDPGGETNFGISKRAYPHLNIAGLTKEQAIQIYYEDYWMPVARLVKTPGMRTVVFDAAVNHGVGRALQWAKEFKNPAQYMANRFMFWSSLSTFVTFGKGWVRRGAKVLSRMEEEECKTCDKRVTLMIDDRPLFVRLAHAFAGRSYNVRVGLRRAVGEEGYKLTVSEQ